MDFRLSCLDKSNWKIYTREKPAMKCETQNRFTQTAGNVRRGYCGRFAPLIAFVLLAFPSHAHASFLHGETLDAVAGAIAWFAFIIVPPVLIVAFLAVHILPEKAAEKRNHPQLPAIKCLCFLSLVFGGLLWPFAWLWAYSKPVFHKMAYGTDVDKSHDEAAGEKSATSELEQLRARVAELEAQNKGGKA
jgi:CBS domain containing-hemolysin-like protein